MKKNLFTMIALMAFLPLQAQFRLTDDGLINSNNKSLNYYTIEISGMDKCAIAEAVGYFTEAQLANRWTQFNGLGCNSFTVNGYAQNGIYNGSGILRTNYNMEYRIMFDFSDGFMRIWAPEIVQMSRTVVSEVSCETGNHKLHKNEETYYLFVSSKYKPLGARSYDYGSTSIFNKSGAVKQKYAKEAIENYFNEFIIKLEQFLIKYTI